MKRGTKELMTFPSIRMSPQGSLANIHQLRSYGLVLPALLLLVSLGCSGSNLPEMAPVEGRVFFQEKPLEGADVTFICAGASRFSSGRTDADGKYTLTTFAPEDGAVVGQNTVTIAMPIVSQSASTPDTPLTGEYFELMKESQVKAAQNQLPTFYADPTTSGLTVDVQPGPNEHDIRLQPAGKKLSSK